MKSFKSFLKENSELTPKIAVNFNLSNRLTDTLTDDYGEQDPYVQKLNELLPNIDFELTSSDTQMCWQIIFPQELSEYNNVNINNVIKPVKKAIKNVFGKEFRTFAVPELFIYDLTKKAEYDLIILDCEHITSLKDIHKILKCEDLTLENYKNIKSNALGILKMDLKYLQYNGISSSWIFIIKKHFDKDKDMIACAEELIENGLKEYAKL